MARAFEWLSGEATKSRVLFLGSRSGYGKLILKLLIFGVDLAVELRWEGNCPALNYSHALY